MLVVVWDMRGVVEAVVLSISRPFVSDNEDGDRDTEEDDEGDRGGDEEDEEEEYMLARCSSGSKLRVEWKRADSAMTKPEYSLSRIRYPPVSKAFEEAEAVTKCSCLIFLFFWTLVDAR